MKILIVDDSKGMRGMVRRVLRQAGYGEHPVVEASNGLEALQVAHASQPDLILTDWNMPEMNGIELIQQLRETGNNVRVGFITSESTDAMKVLAKSAGASFVITKPCTAASMKSALEGRAA